MHMSQVTPPLPRERPTTEIAARTAAHGRWTAQDQRDATSLRLSTLRTCATTPGAHGCNDIRPRPRRELRGRYLVKLTPLILFRVRNCKTGFRAGFHALNRHLDPDSRLACRPSGPQ